MLGLSLFAATATVSFAMFAIVTAVRDQRGGADCLLGALRASGFFVDGIDRYGFRRNLRARADVGPHRLEVRLHAPGIDREAQVSLCLNADLDPSWNIQIHFGEQTSWVLGDEALAAAIASGRLRAVVGPGDQLHVGEGGVCLLLGDPAEAGEAVVALQEIALRLGSRDLDGLLLETATRDPDPRARAEAASALLARRPTVASSLSRDSAPEVRLAVARAVGGDTGFRLAAEILTSEIFHVEIQQGALRYLVSQFEPARVGPVLVDALSAADANLQGALVTALGAIGHAGGIRALHAALPTAELHNVARIAEVLALLEGPCAEPTLVRLLERLPPSGPRLTDEAELATAVADALGRVGSQFCLPALRRLAGCVYPEGPVGIAVKVAIELIRARTGAPELVGALAISGASPVEGRLSLTLREHPHAGKARKPTSAQGHRFSMAPLHLAGSSRAESPPSGPRSSRESETTDS